jgi:hypothetical protein
MPGLAIMILTVVTEIAEFDVLNNELFKLTFMIFSFVEFLDEQNVDKLNSLVSSQMQDVFIDGHNALIITGSVFLIIALYIIFALLKLLIKLIVFKKEAFSKLT